MSDFEGVNLRKGPAKLEAEIVLMLMSGLLMNDWWTWMKCGMRWRNTEIMILLNS
jgi:hypothetical protein